jgi:hypothetical protein
MATASTKADRPRFRRFFQWRLRTLLVGVMLPAALLAGWMAPYWHERQFIGRLRKLGAEVTTVPAGPVWLQRLSDEPPLLHATKISLPLAKRAKITDRDLAGVEKCHELQAVYFNCSAIGDPTLERLDALPQLSDVRISSTAVSIGAAAIFAARHPAADVSFEPGSFLVAANQPPVDTRHLVRAIRLATRWRLAVADYRGDRRARLGAWEWQVGTLESLCKRLATWFRAAPTDGQSDLMEVTQLALAEARIEWAVASGDRAALSSAFATIDPTIRRLSSTRYTFDVDRDWDASGALERAELVARILRDSARWQKNLKLEIQSHQEHVERLQRLVKQIAAARRGTASFDSGLLPSAILQLLTSAAELAALKRETQTLERASNATLIAAADLRRSQPLGKQLDMESFLRNEQAAVAEIRVAELCGKPARATAARRRWREVVRDARSVVYLQTEPGEDGTEVETWAYIVCLDAVERLQEQGDQFLNSPLESFFEEPTLRRALGRLHQE